MTVRHGELEGNTGTHVIRVWRHRDGAVPDTRTIPAEKSWSKRCPYIPIYIQLKESTRTVRARLNALGRMHPRAAKRYQAPSDPADVIDAMDEAEMILNMVTGDEEDADEMEIGPAYVQKMIDYASQRAIIIGHEVPEVKPYDFFETLSEERITEVISKCTERQREELREIARSAPNGILPIAGAGGTGKTTVTIRLLRAALLQGKTALVTSSTNTAIDDIARCAAADMDNEEFLYVRVHLESLEHVAILSYDKRKGRKDGYESGKKAKRASKFCWEMSVAYRVLQVAGVIETQNARLLDLREKSQRLCDILNKPKSEWDEEDFRMLPG